ncbi:MAG: iron-sulfur cluster assembly scaffold protein [Candidatus Magasanikbacteria bacterium]
MTDGAAIRGNDGSKWLYTDIVKDHFFNPRNILYHGEEKDFKADAQGRVGSPACGDEMVIWLKIDPKTEKITECKWQTFGCGSAIASTSMLSLMITENEGMTIEQALKIRPQDIMERLGGLPARKIHCSVLGDKALQAAVNDWFRKTGQHERIITEGSKIIDEEHKITDKDIEEAVLEGARDIEDVLKKLKIENIGEESVQEIEQLIRFYTEKYFG